MVRCNLPIGKYPFLRGLFLEGLIYGGKFAFQNRLGKPYSWKDIYRFCFVLLCIWRQFPSTSPPPPRRGGLYLEGQFNGGFFCVTSLGGVYLEGLIFGILRYCFLLIWEWMHDNAVTGKCEFLLFKDVLHLKMSVYIYIYIFLGGSKFFQTAVYIYISIYIYIYIHFFPLPKLNK